MTRADRDVTVLLLLLTVQGRWREGRKIKLIDSLCDVEASDGRRRAGTIMSKDKLMITQYLLLCSLSYSYYSCLLWIRDDGQSFSSDGLVTFLSQGQSSDNYILPSDGRSACQ